MADGYFVGREYKQKKTMCSVCAIREAMMDDTVCGVCLTNFKIKRRNQSDVAMWMCLFVAGVLVMLGLLSALNSWMKVKKWDTASIHNRQNV